MKWQPALALVLLCACSVPGAGQQSTVKPRGFQAAKQTGRGAVRPPVQQAQLPAQQQTKQQADFTTLQPTLPGSKEQLQFPAPPLHPPRSVPAASLNSPQGCRLSRGRWMLVAAAAAGLFAGGVFLGSFLQRQAAYAPTADGRVVAPSAGEPAGPTAGEVLSKPKEAAGVQKAVSYEPLNGGAQQAGTAPSATASALAANLRPVATVSRQQAAHTLVEAASSSSSRPASLADLGDGGSVAEQDSRSFEAGSKASGPSIEEVGEEAVLLQALEKLEQEQEQQQQQQEERKGQQENDEGHQEQQLQQKHAGTLQQHMSSAPAPAGDSSPAVLAVSSGSSMVAEEDRADIMAAGALVGEMTKSLQIDLGALSSSERLQLLHTVLQAWQAQEAKRHSAAMTRLGSEANVLRGSQRDIAAQHTAHKRARDAHSLATERVAQFRRACCDVLAFGLAVMLAVAGYQVAHGGGVAGTVLDLFDQCGRWAGPSFGGAWGPWALMWRSYGSLRMLSCYIFTAGDAALGLAVLLAAPWAVYRTGLLSGLQEGLPFTRLLAGLGLGCGLAGYVAVGKLGGDSLLWLGVWEVWVALQVAFAAAAHRIFRVTARTAAVPAGAAAGSAVSQAAAESAAIAAHDIYERSFGRLYAVMWITLGVMLPVAAGWLPFRL